MRAAEETIIPTVVYITRPREKCPKIPRKVDHTEASSREKLSRNLTTSKQREESIGLSGNVEQIHSYEIPMNRSVRLTLVLLWGLWVATSTTMEIPEEESPGGGGDVKRSWNNLQASWGKRWPDELDEIDDGRFEGIADGRDVGQKRTWKAINGAWGKRKYQ
uniref:Uncharacterized protein n=1 Tax=Lutzomyia longipalpis TaxID=7200 RepID=A0A1B0CWL8_LUTLO